MSTDSNNRMILPDINIIKDNLESILSQAGLEWDSRVFSDKIISGLDYILANSKNASSSSFNRAIFNHILEFSNIDPHKPILVSDFFNSYFLVYDSMQENKTAYALKCRLVSENIQLYNNELLTLSNTEVPEKNGRTSTSCLRIELERIQIFEDLKDTVLDHVFVNSFLALEPFVLNNNNNNFNSKFRDYALLIIPLTSDSINNKHVFEFPLLDIQTRLNVVYYDVNNKIKIVLDEVKPLDCYDMPISRGYEVPDRGYIDIDIIYVNSKVDYYNRKIIENEEEYKQSHVVYDNLSSSIIKLEEPFSDFIISHRRNKGLETRERNPGDDDIGRKDHGAKITFQRKEIEMSEKIEKTLLSISGRKCIFWETIYFLFNKVMLACCVFVLLSRGDFATVSFIIV